MTRVDGPWNFLLLLGGPWTSRVSFNYLLVLMTRLVLNLHTAYSDVGGTVLLVDGRIRIRIFKITSHFEVTMEGSGSGVKKQKKSSFFLIVLLVDGRIRIRAFSWPDVVFVLNQSVRA